MNGDVSALSDREKQVITEIVKAITAEKKDGSDDRCLVTRAFEYFSKHVAAFLALAACCIALWGYLYYDLSLIEQLSKLKREQERYGRELAQAAERTRVSTQHVELAEAFMDATLYDEALREYELALEVDPLNKDGQFGLFKAQMLADTTNPKSTREASIIRIEHILAESEDDKHALVAYAAQHRFLGNTDKAIAIARSALEKDPELSSAYYLLGIIYGTDLNGTKQAIENLEKALALSPWNDKYIGNLATFYEREKQYNEAKELYRKIIILESRNFQGHYNHANVCLLTGDLSCAHASAARLVRGLHDPKDREYRRNLGSWQFVDETNSPIFIHSNEDKLLFATYYLCLVLLLEDDPKAAEDLLSELGQEREQANKYSVLAVLKSEIGNVRRANPQLKDKLDAIAKGFERQLIR